METPQDPLEALAAGRIRPAPSEASAAGRIRPAPSGVSAAGRIRPAPSGALAWGAATASGCCASRRGWRNLRLLLTNDFRIGGLVKAAYPKAEQVGSSASPEEAAAAEAAEAATAAAPILSVQEELKVVKEELAAMRQMLEKISAG